MGQHLFKSVKSVHIHQFLFFFLTMMMFASHCGYFTSLMKSTSSNLCISAFATFTFSSAILQSFYFFGLALGLTCSRCSMTSLLTATKSKVDHANTSLFLSRKLNSFGYSSWLASAPMHTVLSGTLGSNGTFLNTPSASMMFLYSTGGSSPCWSDCSHKKCIFLCPSAKPFSMFLASCWLPKMDMILKVAGTLTWRYAECKAASKVFKRPLLKMVLYGYGMSTMSNMMYSVWVFLGVPKDKWSAMNPTGSILFPLKP
jgi:hypothetical protein